VWELATCPYIRALPAHDSPGGTALAPQAHPFREGNGRAQRAFFEQLASDAGFTLDWQHLAANRNVTASAATLRR
jgi:hypothetical protein